MVDLSRRGQGLQHWGFSEMGGCYGPAGLPGGPTVVAAMLGGSPPGRTTTRPPWPTLEMSHPHPPPAHQSATIDGFNRYGGSLYSLFPGGDLYTHAAPGVAPRYAHTQPAPAPASTAAYHGLLPPSHKECVFSGFSTGAGTGYSAPVVERGISQLQELMAKGKPRLLEPPPPATPVHERRPKRRSWETTEVKQEGASRSSCACRAKTPIVPVSPGCSRTTPVTLKPAQQVTSQPAGPMVLPLPQVKREPPSTPCQVQVAEVTTSAVKVKQELPDPPTSQAPQSLSGSTNTTNSIPVGIAVARQRPQGQEVRVKEDPMPVLPPPIALLSCERPTNELPQLPWVPPPAHYWPLPAAVPPLDQNLPFQPPVGYQLARDPISGQLLLISTGNNIADSLQRTIVWPNNTTSFPSSPLLLPQAQPMTGHLLLDRLVTLATPTPPPPPVVDKRRPPQHPHAHQHPLIKIEEPPLTGVMPCAKSSVVIQQLSTQQTATPLLNPQFSTIASSGSVLIQHISSTNPQAIIPPHNPPSVLISAQQLTTEAQSLAPSVVISHSQQDSTAAVITDLLGAHTQQLPLVIGAESFTQQSQAPPPQIHLQIKEPPKEEIEETEPVQTELQIEPKIEPINGCRSQGTSPVGCLSPGPIGVGECASQSQSEDESCSLSQPVVQQADASNQTDSLPPSSDDEDMETSGVPAQDTQPVPALAPAPAPAPAPITSASETQAVDLSGLELLSAASCQHIVRSHSAPLAETTKIKTEIEEEVAEESIPRASTPIPELSIKEEVEPVDTLEEESMEEANVSDSLTDDLEVDTAVTDETADPSADRSEPGIIGGLGLLCDVAHRFIEEEAAASRPQSPCDEQDKSAGWSEADRGGYRPDSPYDPAELDMRVRLAELQRLYRQKQRELTRLGLSSRKSVCSDASSSGSDPCPAKRGPGRPRKHAKRLSSSDGPGREKRPRSVSPAVSPPVLEPWSAVKCRTEGLPPPTLTPHKAGAGSLNKSAEPESQQVEWELISPSKSPPPLSPAVAPAQSPSSASQKRKVGRPRKRIDLSSLTIVAKKPRSKNSLVGLLLAKKHLPESTHGPNKIKPKLKAEAKVKSWCDDEDVEWTATPTRRHSVATTSPGPGPSPARPVKSKSLPTPGSSSSHKPHKKPTIVLVNRKRTLSTEQPPQKSGPQPITVQGVASCQLTNDHLSPGRLPCRVLVAMGGLFYAGQLSAVRPPDLYGVTLDGERGHRPHIHSREEILRDSILEMCTQSLPPPGTRVCAYWSQQYRCLYPGTVPTPSSVDDYDSRFVCVEFDDGDSGRISLEDIRLLPQDYPIVVYDPNPLQSLGKRRRRNSGASCDSQTKDKTSQPMETISEVGDAAMEQDPENEEEMEMEGEAESVEENPRSVETPCTLVLPSTDVDSNTQPTNVELSILNAEAMERERRRQKKKRKEKLRRLDSEKRHRHKHRDCLKSHRHKHKHRHHKHKHRHSKSIVTIENGSLIEEKKPLTLVVHTNPPILSTIKLKKEKKRRERQGSAESRSKMAAFLPDRQLWRWAGRSYKRPGAKGRARKDFYRTIQRGNETISVGDCAVFLSTGRPDRPYIGRIESMWESWASSMVVKVKWFYHPEETVGCPEKLPYPGALFESPHNDENDVQTISHKCEVLPLDTYKDRLRQEPHRLATIYDYNDIYYLAGYYDPTTTALRFEPGVNL